MAGLNVRFIWYTLPKSIVAISSVAFLAGYLIYTEVLCENKYFSRTIEIQDGQRVIDTGLYGIVRHPMYGATVLMFLSLHLYWAR